MSDQDVSSLIRNDKIDILIDLTGHTNLNRLLVFSMKPAPIQITYLGYPATTGLSTIDYRLTDQWADPPGLDDQYYSETLIHLRQGFLCYRPPENTPDIGDCPAKENGYITFGSFNNLAKITPEVINCWAEILSQIPNSRLIIKNKSMIDVEVKNYYLGAFNKKGITSNRLEIFPEMRSFSEHLSLYNKVDIALDTFPYNGTTTTCEALWMGVPIITLKGDRHAGRVGVSLLTRTEMTDFIADTIDEYIAKAIEFSGKIDLLADIRTNMRDRLSKSPLCNAQDFTRNLEETYRMLWRKWCTETPGTIQGNR